MSEVEVTIGLGSNIGDKVAILRAAADRLVGEGLVRDAVLSSLYRTPPWGDEAQDWFVNACMAGATGLAPLDLLARIKTIELELGRVPTRRWGPRAIDIDILAYGDVLVDTPVLTLPHRHLLERPFVLVPLVEIRPDLVIRGVAVRDALERLDRQGIVKLEPSHALDGARATPHL